MENKGNPVWAGLSVLGSFIVGLIGMLAGLLAILNEFDYIGAGLCFLASGLAFGLLANSIYRK